MEGGVIAARSKPTRIAVAGATGLVGSQIVDMAERAGHVVVPLSRSNGVDLTQEGSIEDRLDGVAAVIDVTRSPSMDQREATEFFTTVARELGHAARAAGVHRTVVQSIAGVEQSQDFPWYVATLAHERATREHAPDPQFHEFPGQVQDRALLRGFSPNTRYESGHAVLIRARHIWRARIHRAR